MSDPTLHHEPARSRYELHADGRMVGHVDYRDDGGRVVLTHTEIDPAEEGKGYGSRLAALLLEQLQADGRQVVPACSFIAGYIRRHPDLAGLVAPEAREA